MAQRRAAAQAGASLPALVDRLTDKRAAALDPTLMAELKGRCKASSEWRQVRLLALNAAAELFQRSKAFRTAVAGRFAQLLELVVGHREGAALPPPAPAAQDLRSRALELVERWAADHGDWHKQLALGHSYLKNTLQMRFPEIDARAAARRAAEAEAAERERAAATARFAALAGGEWEEGRAEYEALLGQMEEAFALLAGGEGGAGRAAAGGGGAAPSDGSGLAAAAAELWEDDDDGVEWEDVATEGEESTGDAAAATQSAPGAAAAGGAGSAGDAVLEALHGSYLLVHNRALPRVQEWLRVIVRAEGGQPRQREALLRHATDLKARLVTAAERFLALGLDLAALAERQRARQEQQHAAAAAEREWEQERQRQRAAAAAEREWEQERQRQRAAGAGADPQRGGGGVGAASSDNPYATLIDPAAPRPQPQRPSSMGRTRPEKAAQPPSGAQPSLPEDYWDTGAAAWAGGSAMEVNNHWGPVDAHRELPRERMEELFMYVPEREREQQAAHVRQQVQQLQQERSRQRQEQERRQRERQQREQQDAAAQLASMAPLLGAVPRAAQRAQDRAYNEAVIGGALIDEQLAQALAEGAAGGGAVRGEPAPKRRKKQSSVRERLEARVRRAGRAADEERAAEDAEAWRDRGANRF
eukprot:scaffold12.g8176.t1